MTITIIDQETGITYSLSTEDPKILPFHSEKFLKKFDTYADMTEDYIDVDILTGLKCDTYDWVTEGQ